MKNFILGVVFANFLWRNRSYGKSALVVADRRLNEAKAKQASKAESDRSDPTT